MQRKDDVTLDIGRLGPGFDSGDWPTDSPDYPRRQFQRRDWLCLNGEWRFAFDDDRRATHPSQIPEWDRRIQVPFAPESPRSGIHDEGFHANHWYEREFELEPAPGRTLLHFGAVDYTARVWVNGVLVGGHEGGHTPFSLDITDALKPGGTQTVAVWAQDDPADIAKPRGKQDWQLRPHGIWYPRTSGIWQTVWVERVPDVYLDRIRWTPDLSRWEFDLAAYVHSHERIEGLDLELRVRLSVDDRILADDSYRIVDNEVHRRLALSDPGIDDFRNELLWSPEKPTLVDAQIQLVAGGSVIDEIRSYTALRRIALQRGRAMLNNRPYYMRLVLDQGYWPDTLMTPPSEEAIIEDIRLIKAAGFNGVRKHQKIEDPRFLYWADRMGLLVWEEMPSAYRFTHEAVERLVREWMEVIDRDSNHPCIVVWVPFNESWGVPDLPDNEAHRSFVQSLYHLTRTLDPTRPVIGNDGWESTATDILTIHDYDDDPERILRRYGTAEDLTLRDAVMRGFPSGRVLTLEGHPHSGQPVMLTEFGGIAYSPPEEGPDGVWGYSVTSSSGDLQERYAKLISAVSRVEALGGFCYTQFTDTYQEANGLFFADRTPKFPLEGMRKATHGTGLSTDYGYNFTPGN
ncbi:glycoside hydrolase family 2 TIM barrel-domain containing protein [Naasia sp.]|uniref:glycoside hydrolase family 2 protein n=1 Tax=Naasia sp. TaxID=2546198 RepID=UPI002631C93E|nr:glycoside hydrolase family 2 TIM barrel-domain containing protein [Naasia sp.]